jgi:hypothetical protein
MSDSGDSESSSNKDKGFSVLSFSRRWKGVEDVSMPVNWDTLKILDGDDGWRRPEIRAFDNQRLRIGPINWSWIGFPGW